MKRIQKYLLIIVFLFSFFILNGKTADAATITVSGTTGTAIQSALNSASSGDTIIIPSGTYSVTSQIQQTSKDLTVVGQGTVILNVSMGSAPALKFSGSLVSNKSLTTSVSAGDTQCLQLWAI